jgi:hypothetical protein
MRRCAARRSSGWPSPVPLQRRGHLVHGDAQVPAVLRGQPDCGAHRHRRHDSRPGAARAEGEGPTPTSGDSTATSPPSTLAASGLADVLIDYPTVADLGYVGVEGIDTVPYKRFPGIDLNLGQVEFNTSLSKTRAAVEHAIAHLKTWRMLSEEGGRYRAPLEKYPSMIKAVTGLFFFATYE